MVSSRWSVDHEPHRRSHLQGLPGQWEGQAGRIPPGSCPECPPGAFTRSLEPSPAPKPEGTGPVWSCPYCGTWRSRALIAEGELAFVRENRLMAERRETEARAELMRRLQAQQEHGEAVETECARLRKLLDEFAGLMSQRKEAA